MVDLDVDNYFQLGCGRCNKHSTADCKVQTWKDELTLLRRVVLTSGLVEELKWQHPCYTLNGANIVLIRCFKSYCAISFMKGALLSDKSGILVKPTENVQSGRQIRFTSINEVISHQNLILEYIAEAMELERSGAKIKYKETAEFDMPVELTTQFNQVDGLKNAFYLLTPGRQRGYILYFNAAKQSKTKTNRILKHIPDIFAGKGLND